MVRGKKVLVIGAAGLLGANLTKTLLDNGACVLAADLSVSGLKSSLAGLGIALNDTNIELHQVDLNDIRSIEAIFTRTDRLTGAVNCSYPRNENYGAKLFDVTLEDFNQNIALSLGSAFLFMQQCAKYF
jgi:NAD(P)-dependent dehydrogenase (short-subunit alcohol dehydrogenase family)